jgi:hypothetical protein
MATDLIVLVTWQRGVFSSEDGIERRPDLVRHRGQERVFEIAGPFGRFAQGLCKDRNHEQVSSSPGLDCHRSLQWLRRVTEGRRHREFRSDAGITAPTGNIPAGVRKNSQGFSPTRAAGRQPTHLPAASAPVWLMQSLDGERRAPMLYTIAIILLILWLLGLVSGYTIGAFVHTLLVVAIVLFLVGLLSGRRVV